jgi:hypothetical protein
MNTPANRLAPVLAVLILLTVMAAWFGPGLYRNWRFNQSCLQLLKAAKEGRTADVIAGIVPDQQQQIDALVKQYVPANYNKDIDSLKLTSWNISANDQQTIWAIATCRIQQGGDFGIFQCKMCWRWRDGHWWWDFNSSYGGEFSTSGEPEWTELSKLVELSELL